MPSTPPQVMTTAPATSASTSHETILELAVQLGRRLDSKEKLESALTAAIQTAFKEHHVTPFSRDPIQPVPQSSATSLPSERPTIAVQNPTPPSTHPKAGTIISTRSQHRRERLLSPSVARNRYRRMLQPQAIPDDTSVYSEFLTASDFDSEWDREAAAIQVRARQVTNKTNSLPISGLPRTKRRQETIPPPPLPTPPQSDELQPLSSPIRPTASVTTPLKDPFVYHPPAFIQDDIYATTRPRSSSTSSTTSSSSCSSTSTIPPPPTSSALSSIPDYQYILSQERRRHRAHRATKRGLPIPPPTPPPLPAPTSFPTSRGHTIPGRDITTKKRKASDFLGNHGRLAPDKPPHIRKALRLELSETPIVDLLYHPSAALPYAEKDQITTALTRTIELKAKLPNTSSETPPWLSKFELRPPKTASRKVKAKRYCYDFSTQSVRGTGLRARLASVWGIVPYDAKKAREGLEKALLPLVVANRGRFGVLEGCGFWGRWRGWVVVVE